MRARLMDLFGGRSGAAGAVEYLVVGLGNPGKQYEATRHNAGYLALDRIAREAGATVNRLKFKGLTGDATIGGKRVLLLKPTTYMNNSGEAVREAMQFYKVPPERVIVLSDDVSLEVGKLRIRSSGSDGGQKGLRSIIAHTGGDTFPRIRIGVGKKPHPDMELADWVLSGFTKADAKLLEPVWDQVAQAVELIVKGDTGEAMNRFN